MPIFIQLLTSPRYFIGFFYQIYLDEWGQHRGECLPGFEDMMPTSNYCFAMNLSGLETWDDAENICRIMSQYHGGHLVTIYSTAMNSAISRYIRNHSQDNITTEIWIGLQNVDLDKGSMSTIILYVLISNVDYAQLI